jgi:AmmeMemoRadiSam system protein A
MLTKEQQTTLLQIARDSIDGGLAGKRIEIKVDQYEEPLQRPAGAFVTLRLRKDKTLRGCIGSILPVSPLCRAVATSALSAAFRDPRFLPLAAHEWPLVGLEISVMGALIPVAHPDEIVCGRDGLIVRRGPAAGLLLPQVATEHGWDRDTFLGFTCSKAGLPHDAWRTQPVSIERFEAFVFAE